MTPGGVREEERFRVEDDQAVDWSQTRISLGLELLYPSLKSEVLQTRQTTKLKDQRILEN